MDRRRGQSDRRDGPRAALVAAVRDADNTRLFLSQDLSSRGMSVLRPDEPPLPPAMHLEFELPGGYFVRALARVISDRSGGRWRRTGLEFLGMRPDDVTLLDAFVKSSSSTAGSRA